MIVAALTKPDGGKVLLLVLEPGNLLKLREGKPIHKFIAEFEPNGLGSKDELMIAYTPDAEWVAEQMRGREQNGEVLAQVVNESLSRAEVVVPGRMAETMRRVT